MNDPTEGTYSARVVGDVLDNMGVEADDPIRRQLLAEVAGRWMPTAEPHDDGYLITSFSEDSDLLGMWRNYGDEGAGYSLRFDCSHFFNQQHEYVPEMPVYNSLKRLHRVDYNRESQEATVRRIAENTDEGWKEMWRLRFVKDIAYGDEREWRLIVPFRTSSPSPDLGYQKYCVGETEPEYRSTPHGIAPYKLYRFVGEVDPQDRSLTFDLVGLTCGPGRSSEIQVWSTEKFLHAHGFPKIRAVPSLVPMR